MQTKSAALYALKRVSAVLLILTLLLAAVSVISAVSANPKKLKDGTYHVSVSVYQADKDAISMSAPYFKKTAKIAAKNGSMTMTLYADTATIQKAMPDGKYKIDLQVSNGKGGYTQAKVAARNAQGSPTAFSFPLPNTSTYVPIRLNPHVAAMGNSYVNARLRIDYSTI